MHRLHEAEVMVHVLTTFGLILGAVILVGLVWRYAYFCPSWLAPLLENPYVEAIAGAALLLRRAGVRPGMQILDAGCGPGRITLPAAEAVGASGRVVALDIQSRMLEELGRRLRERGIGNVETVLAGLGDDKLPESMFDVAFLVTVLGEVPDKERALREIHRGLRQGGVLSVTELLPDPHYQSMSRVRELAKGAGFVEQQVFPGIVSYTINFAKDGTG